MSAGSCPSEQQLQAFQLGNLPEPTLNEIAEHLETCARCESLAQQLDSAVDPIAAAIRQPADVAFQLTKFLERPPMPQRLPPNRAAAPDTFPFLRPAVQPDEIGRLGNYRVLRLLGKGGMAFVFHAEDEALRRPVALKVMKPDLDHDELGWQRFLREARIMAAIKHRHLVTIYQAGQDGDTVWLAMELLAGESLNDRLHRAGPAAVSEVLRLGQELAQGLSAIHAHGLVHRDLKPANIWLEAPDNRIKILDFGLARFMNEQTILTLPGTVLGTPAYMAPEQARGEHTDARTDLFSLGCVLYTLCTGVKPFGAENTMSVLRALAIEHPRPVHELRPDILKPLSNLIDQLLAKAPDDRPATAEVVLQRLRQLEAPGTGTPDQSAGATQVSGVIAESTTKAIPSPVTNVQRSLLAGTALVLLAMLCLASWTWVYGEPDPTGATPIPGATYLFDLPESERLNWPFTGPLPSDFPNEPSDWPRPRGGRRVRVAGVPSLHGIFMHLPAGPGNKKASLTFRLDQNYRTFTADICLNDGPDRSTPLTFTVLGDGRVLWQSQPVITQADRQSCQELSVAGVDQLTLQISGVGKEHGSHAVWIEPYLLK